MRKWIQQLPGKKNCGVIAVAVIAGVSVEEAEKAIGKKGATKAKELATGLRKLGYQCPDRCIRFTAKTPISPLAIGHLTDPKRKSGWHWIVIDGERIYDGISGSPDGLTVRYPKSWKITSYLPVTKI